MTEDSYVSFKKSGLTDLWPDHFPLLPHIDIELTERCNNDCIHCSICKPEDCEDTRRHELSAEDIIEILADAVLLGASSVRFTGGEPLLRGDFEEIYLFARRLGLRVFLFTNARLITSRIAELLKTAPPLEKVEITVYGMTERSYESVTRTKGSHAEFIKGIELLISLDIPFLIKGAMLPSTMAELDEFETWASSISWMENPPALAMLFNLRDRRDSFERDMQIKKIRLSPEKYISILHRRPAEYLRDTLKFCGRFIGPPGDRLFSCGSGHSPCVDAYGNLQMCLPLRHPDTVYPIKQGSLHDGLTALKAKAGDIKATNSVYLDRCALCFLKGLCEQCPAKSWSEHGTLDTPVEYLCNIAHALAGDLGLLAPGEKGWDVRNWRERVAKAAAKLL